MAPGRPDWQCRKKVVTGEAGKGEEAEKTRGERRWGRREAQTRPTGLF